MPDGDFHLATLSLSQSHSAIPSGLDPYDAGPPTLKRWASVAMSLRDRLFSACFDASALACDAQALTNR